MINFNWTSIPEGKTEHILNEIIQFSKKIRKKVIFVETCKTYKSIKIDFNHMKEISFLTMDSYSLKQFVALFMGCYFYLGSSLHCAITAFANYKFAGLIHTAPLTKFQELYGHLYLTELYSQDKDVPTVYNTWDSLIQNIVKDIKKYEHNPILYKTISKLVEEEIQLFTNNNQSNEDLQKFYERFLAENPK